MKISGYVSAVRWGDFYSFPSNDFLDIFVLIFKGLQSVLMNPQIYAQVYLPSITPPSLDIQLTQISVSVQFISF